MPSSKWVLQRLSLFIYCVVLTGSLFTASPSLRAERSVEQRRMQWSEIALLIHDKKVGVVTSDGSVLSGRVTEVTEEAITLDVKETTNREHYPKGRTIVSRQDVLTIQLVDTAGKWRLVGTAIGVGGGAVAGWGLAEGVYHVSGEKDGLFKEPHGLGLLFGTAAGAGAPGLHPGQKVRSARDPDLG